MLFVCHRFITVDNVSTLVILNDVNLRYSRVPRFSVPGFSFNQLLNPCPTKIKHCVRFYHRSQAESMQNSTFDRIKVSFSVWILDHNINSCILLTFRWLEPTARIPMTYTTAVIDNPLFTLPRCTRKTLGTIDRG